jgi:hypothetical protein
VRRAALAAGAALGAFALAPAAAHAADFEVNTLNDAAADPCTTDPNGCTLRDAFAAAVANGTEADTITFASGLTGDLNLTQGELATDTMTVDNITIQGPGADLLTVHASPTSRIFHVYTGFSTGPGSGSAGDGTTLNISGLTLSDGNPTSGPGGAIDMGKYTTLALSDTTLSGNTSPSANGGALALSKYARVSLDHTTITGNDATTGAGGAIGSVPFSGMSGPKYYFGSGIMASDSTISGNTAVRGGGIQSYGHVAIHNSTLSGNHATTGEGGAIRVSPKYAGLDIGDSEISGNTAGTVGGGIAYLTYTGGGIVASDNRITNTAVAGNTAASRGGGIYTNGVGYAEGSFTVDHSTISGNQLTNTTSYGGGVAIGSTPTAGVVTGTFQVVDSTLSGNSAGAGGGMSVEATVPGSVSADNSTIASNTATYEGGGIWAGSYGASPGPYSSPPVQLGSTIVGDDSPDDLGRADAAASGNFQLAFSLVEAPTDAIGTQANSITGQDPQLGGLTNNGGPTLTQLPATTSPAIDAGQNPLGLPTDQRGQPRTVDETAANAADATDIGSVERPPPVPAPQPGTKKPKCKKKHKKHKKHKRSAESSKKKHKKHNKCKKKHKKHKKKH